MDTFLEEELFLSSRVKFAAESITLKLNEKANLLAESGHQVFNLTAGQLPFRPLPEFVEKLASELNFLKSFQYSWISYWLCNCRSESYKQNCAVFINFILLFAYIYSGRHNRGDFYN